jgi:hypothetical protein
MWLEEFLEVLRIAEKKWPNLRKVIKKRKSIIYFSEVINYLKNW